MKQSLTHHLMTAFSMGTADCALKYRVTRAGYLWVYFSMLARCAILWFVFGVAIDLPIEHYPLYVYLGLLFWEFFAATTVRSMTIINERKDLITRVCFPRWILMMSVTWMQMIIVLLLLVPYIILVPLFTNISFPLMQLWYVPILLIQISLITSGVGMLLAAFVLQFRDIQNLWSLFLQIFMWLTPVVYSPLQRIAHIETSSLHIIWQLLFSLIAWNPLTIFLDHARNILLSSQPSLPTFTSSLTLTLMGLILCAVGCFVFQKRSVHFAEQY